MNNFHNRITTANLCYYYSWVWAILPTYLPNRLHRSQTTLLITKTFLIIKLFIVLILKQI